MFRSLDTDDVLFTETGIANGLNQLTQYAGQSLAHDDKGNVTAFGSDSFTYSSENLLKTATVAGVLTALQYDPLLRLYQTNSVGVPIARYAYDGLNALAEYHSSGALQRRWVFDPTTGQPVVWYEGTGTGTAAKRYLSADERGSIISVSDSTGAALSINTYDEYGIPAATNVGRYGYIGQAWLGAAKLWYLNARQFRGHNTN